MFVCVIGWQFASLASASSRSCQRGWRVAVCQTREISKSQYPLSSLVQPLRHTRATPVTNVEVNTKQSLSERGDHVLYFSALCWPSEVSSHNDFWASHLVLRVKVHQKCWRIVTNGRLPTHSSTVAFKRYLILPTG